MASQFRGKKAWSKDNSQTELSEAFMTARDRSINFSRGAPKAIGVWELCSGTPLLKKTYALAGGARGNRSLGASPPAAWGPGAEHPEANDFEDLSAK